MVGYQAIANVLWGGSAFALVLAHFYAEAFRWWVAYLRPSVRWTRVRDLFNATALASYLLPFKLGLPLRLLMVSRYTGMTRLSTAGFMAMDSAISIVAWSAVGFALGGQILLRNFHFSPALAWISIAVLCVALAAVWLSGRLREVGQKIEVLRSAIRAAPGKVLLALVLVAIDVASYGARHACMALASGADPLLALGWASWGIVATFAGMASGVPMGLGGYDATLALVAASHGVPATQIAAVIALNRGMSLGAAVLTGLPASGRLGLGGSFGVLASKLREMISGR